MRARRWLAMTAALTLAVCLPVPTAGRAAPPAKPERWIVRFADQASAQAQDNRVRAQGSGEVRHRFTRVFPGMAVTMDAASAQARRAADVLARLRRSVERPGGADRLEVVDLRAAAEAALRAPEPHIPYPTGVEYPHVTGSAKCAPDHKLWLDAEAAREDIRERLALELPEDEELTDDLIAAQLATDPRYPAWVSAEQACATAVVRRASERGTEATDSDRRTLMRKRAAFINQGGDVTSAAYFDDVLEPEQREGFFKRQWEKSGRTSPVWRRLYEQTRDKRVAAKLATRTRSVKIAPPKRTKAPAVRAAAKTIKANPAPSAQACVGHRVVAATSIRPPHEVRRPAHLRALAARMRAHGWVGRPLLVEHSPAHGYQAWTGSHRIAAAQLVGLDVPIVVVPSRAFARTGMKPGRSGFYFHAIRPTTAARHAHAQACGCPYATALLAAELESDRARGAA